MKLQIFNTYFTSFCVTAFAIGYFFMIYYFFNNSFNNFENIKLNDLGTFLGGVTAPLVFFILLFQYLKSQDQFIKNLKKENAEKIEKERMAQPLFDFKNSYFSEIDDFPSGKCFDLLTFKVTNYLADATDVVIQIVSKDEDINSKIGKSRKIFRGDEEVITIRFDEFKPREFEIIVSYYDSLRLFKTKKYKCHKNHDDYCDNSDHFHTESQLGLKIYELENGN